SPFWKPRPTQGPHVKSRSPPLSSSPKREPPLVVEWCSAPRGSPDRPMSDRAAKLVSMANRILKIRLLPGANGSMVTHIERVLWAHEFVLDATNDEPREEVAQRIQRGEVFYTVGTDGRRANVEVFVLHHRLYLRTIGDTSQADNLL